MIKKTVTYTDYDGVERTETFYFHLSEAELLEMEFSASGGFTKMIEKLIETKDAPRIMGIFKDILLKSYGEKSADGRRFIKSEELSTEFSQTPAYTKLFVELATDADAATEFVNGLVEGNNARPAEPPVVAVVQ